MTLPTDDRSAGFDLPDEPSGWRPKRERSAVVGWISLAVAFVVLGVLALAPTPYVIQKPGPVFNVLGTTTTDDGKQPLIVIDGTKTYDVSDTLDMLTVSIVGNPEQSPSWFQLAVAWFDPSQAVVPMEMYFPDGTTQEQRDEESQLMMVNSQQDAVAAALTELDIDFASQLTVGNVIAGTPADGILHVGDEILAAGDEPIVDVDDLRDVIERNGDDSPLPITVRRDGAEIVLDVTPTSAENGDGSTGFIVGIQTAETYDFPFDVSIKLDDVGGPSAGMMFALGIIDKLTPGALSGDAAVAGTGTIDAEGDVGPIGGIRQKLYGARDSGADYFLAPADNCGDVVGHVPDGIRVFSVETLEDSMAVLDALAGDSSLDDFATCEP